MLELLGKASEGDMARIRYRYRSYEFTIEREGRTWSCHGGISIPDSEIALFPQSAAICHEAGWITRGRERGKDKLLQKLIKAIDQDIAKRDLKTRVP